MISIQNNSHAKISVLLSILSICTMFHSGGHQLHAQDMQPEPKTKELIELIQSEVDQLSERSANVNPAYITSVSIMNHIQRIVSPLKYSVLKTRGEKTPSTVEQCLIAKAGICGNQIACFLQIAEHFELRVRPVEFYLHGETPQENSSHICAEVFYDSDWHLFDVTWGTYFLLNDEIASASEIRNSPSKARAAAITNQTDQWYLHWRRSGLDPFVYVDHKSVDVLRGRNGIIRLRSTDGSYTPIHQPNFIGLNSLSPDFGAVRVELLNVEAGTSMITIHVLGRAGDGELIIKQAMNSISVPISELDKGANEIVLTYKVATGNLEIKMKPTDPAQIGYVVFSRIQATSSD